MEFSFVLIKLFFLSLLILIENIMNKNSIYFRKIEIIVEEVEKKKRKKCPKKSIQIQIK